MAGFVTVSTFDQLGQYANILDSKAYCYVDSLFFPQHTVNYLRIIVGIFHFTSTVYSFISCCSRHCHHHILV